MRPNLSFLLPVSLLRLTVDGISAHAQTIRIEGSSAGLTISQTAAAEFRRGHKDVAVNVGVSGSGGALGKFCRGELDLAHSARPVLKGEIEACRKTDVSFIELPLAFDA